MSNVVKLPKPSRTAYNPNRPLDKNTLIEAQVKHFHHVDKELPKEFQTGIDIATVRTEGEASKYIGLVTQALHKRGARPAPKTETAR